MEICCIDHELVQVMSMIKYLMYADIIVVGLFIIITA